MSLYRKLNQPEIEQLKKNGCSASDWNTIDVKDAFDTVYVHNVIFSGAIKLGVFDCTFEQEGGVPIHSGIYNATLHNCEVGDNTLISNVANYIANYKIGNNCIITNIGTMAVVGESSFGNGVSVSVLDETGSREVIIHDKLSSHQAYVYSFWKYKEDIFNRINSLITRYIYSKKTSIGFVVDNSLINSVVNVKNVIFCHSSVTDGAARLENGTVGENAFVGSNVIAENFIFSAESSVSDSAKLNRCFVGEACHIGSGFSAIDSLFFANSHMENGEACALFAGPYTVSHHKSTLLIGALFSFMNAGSGSNQSNHMYKHGPIHYGVAERGVKLASDSYIAFPAKVGTFSLVMGRHYGHSDTSELPFSYLIENSGKTYLAPAINYVTVGTYRDAQKWITRDARKRLKTDSLSFSVLNPYTVQRVFEAKALLKRIALEQEDTGAYEYNNCLIAPKALEKGVKIYELMFSKYLGDVLIANFDKRNEKVSGGSEEWIDLCGLVAPKSEIEKLITGATDLDDLNKSLAELLARTKDLEWNWAKAWISADNYKEILDNWLQASTELNRMILNDAAKEYDNLFQICYGVDGNEEDRQSDFCKVRGNPDQHKLVQEIKEQMAQDAATYKKILQKL